MSLRARLTLLYASLLGGILLLLGTAMYVMVNVALMQALEGNLQRTVQEISEVMDYDTSGAMDLVIVPSLELTSGTYVQVWDRRGALTSASPGIRDLTEPLDPDGMEASRPVFRDAFLRNIHLRVLSVPLFVGERRVGTIQAATSLQAVDTVRENLLTILVFGGLISMLIAAFAAWVSIGQALAPLKTVTKTALLITRADDLSRRIPYDGPERDEIGKLILAFNQTLQRLEQLFTSQQRFLADVSHELRTPLTVIKGNADLIRKLGADEESLNTITEESDRLTRLVGDLLLLAQAESGKLPLTLVPVEMDSLLMEVFQQMRVFAAEKVSIKIDAIDQAIVEGDRDRLKQVLINLISNAIKFTPQGGTVTLSLTRDERRVRVYVRDTGPGIPSADLEHIFDRFYRTEKARTRSKSGGFGLGLSIAYWIVDMHEGKIDVESKEGQGTCFCVNLPLAS
jgi:two-component system, OmpR family, sensor kinase